MTMDWLVGNPWIIEWAAYVFALLLGVSVVVAVAPTLERLLTPTVPE